MHHLGVRTVFFLGFFNKDMVVPQIEKYIKNTLRVYAL